MTNFKAKLATGLATGALLAGVYAPVALADTSVNVARNGRNSENKVKVKNTKTTRVRQSNTNYVTNLTGVLQNTGGNRTNDNTGDNVNVRTGSTTATVTNNTVTGGNGADIELCGCEDDETSVNIRRNGRNTTNGVSVSNMSSTKVSQSNVSVVTNGTLVVQNTGLNNTSDNTGGDVTVQTGNANATVTNNVTTGGNGLNL